jgi:CheY-like chemotaxis protein
MTSRAEENSTVATGVVAVVDDLLFGEKLRTTARRLRVDLAFARSPEDATALTGARRPALVIVDLQSEACRPLDTIRRIKADPNLCATPVLGYFAHVRDDVRAAAVEAGCDEVLPRSAFSVRLAEILQRGVPAIGESSPPAVPSGATP